MLRFDFMAILMGPRMAVQMNLRKAREEEMRRRERAGVVDARAKT
jgi:hypothetical protein